MGTGTESRRDPLLPWVGGFAGCWAIARVALALTQTDAHLAFGLHPAPLGAPLLSWLVALVGAAGPGPVAGGFLVNALASVGLIGVVAWLLRAFGVRWSYALSVGLVASLYPPVSLPGWVYGPAALATLFGVLALAAAVRTGPRPAALAGAAFGLAWLAGGDALALLPAIVAYRVVSDRLPEAGRALLAFGVAAALVTAPTLVLGSPADRGPTVGTVTGAAAAGAPPTGGLALPEAAPLGGWAGALLVALVLAGLRHLWHTRRREVGALALLVAAHLGSWAIVGGRPPEAGGVAVVAVFAAVVGALGFAALARAAFARGVSRPLVLAAEAVVVIVLVVRPAVAGTTRLFAPADTPPPPTAAGASLACPDSGLELCQGPQPTRSSVNPEGFIVPR